MQLRIANISLHLVAFITAILFFSCKNSSKPPAYQPVYSTNVDSDKTLLLGLPAFSFYDSFENLCKYLTRKLPGGVRVQPVAAVSFDEYAARTKKGEFAITFSNGAFALQLDSLNYSIVAKVIDDSKYRGVILTRKDSVFKTVGDLSNKIICCPGLSTLAGAKMPLYFLARNGLNVKTDLKIMNVTSFETVFMNVYLGKCSAGTAWLESWDSFAKLRPDIGSKLEVRWQTDPLPNVAMLLRDDVDPLVKNALIQLFIDLPKSEEGKKLLQQIGYAGFEKADATNYRSVKDFLNMYEKTITGLTVL